MLFLAISEQPKGFCDAVYLGVALAAASGDLGCPLQVLSD